ncbi:MAG: hypothetical protein E7313_05765 [Clostridiales bacterium]|nr:hypothetical protein [Clostridiales bacterium]
MDNRKMRNTLVLKNLPSNVIEEAFVVIKDNQKLKKYEYIDGKNQNLENKKELNNSRNENDIVIREAEYIISDYINKLEKQDICGNKYNIELNKKYKNMKKVVIILNLIIVGLMCYIKVKFNI